MKGGGGPEWSGSPKQWHHMQECVPSKLHSRKQNEDRYFLYVRVQFQSKVSRKKIERKKKEKETENFLIHIDTLC